jgi:hypothetical protein
MNAVWRKSSLSFANGGCVEVAVPGGSSVGIGDTSDPEGPHLTCHFARKVVNLMQCADCPRRASNRQTLKTRSAWIARHQMSHQFSTAVEKFPSGDEADKGSLPGKNSQMFSPRHVESGDA